MVDWVFEKGDKYAAPFGISNKKQGKDFPSNPKKEKDNWPIRTTLPPHQEYIYTNIDTPGMDEK